jgi:hypothetical protein
MTRARRILHIGALGAIAALPLSCSRNAEVATGVDAFSAMLESEALALAEGRFDAERFSSQAERYRDTLREFGGRHVGRRDVPEEDGRSIARLLHAHKAFATAARRAGSPDAIAAARHISAVIEEGVRAAQGPGLPPRDPRLPPGR